ncbi:MAG TPA: radical SAM/SPASM domain-containing protein [bacterium]|nr:radical SAM/SPASM domain-containing protein [bacterium]HPN30904.1 radical SAM/SPASM domain-containing protein [bacterium]
MFDIFFYQKIFDLKKRLQAGERFDLEFVKNKFNEFRSKEPVIYNIETTNACNMRCVMCPRTTMMTRKVETISLDLFQKIADQLKPFSESELNQWENFVQTNYNIKKESMSENHFFLFIIPKVLVLHGYGDPLLDKDMPNRIAYLRKKGIPSYFSCNPANIDIDKTIEMFENGLGYVKYSIESVDDAKHKQIRGSQSNFTQSFKKIEKLLELKKKNNYQTTIVITMLNLNNSSDFSEEFEELKKAFKNYDVYIYLKSQDQQWYQQKNIGTQSIHWTEFCQFPWSSMTIKSNGESVECVEDYNNEIILGNCKTKSLYEIWNSEAYEKLRNDHFYKTPGIKCSERCDMKLIGEYL